MCSYQEIEGEVIADEKWIPTQVTDSNDGERGRNRTYNLLIKSQSSVSLESFVSAFFINNLPN